MFSGLPPTADTEVRGWHVSVGANTGRIATPLPE
jgi:hypothetical protein